MDYTYAYKLTDMGIENTHESHRNTWKELSRILEAEPSQTKRRALYKSVEEISDIRVVCKKINPPAVPSDAFDRELYISNVLAYTLIKTGIVSKPFAAACLPFGYYDDYYRLCAILASGGKITKDKTASWLQDNLVLSYDDGGRFRYTIESIHKALETRTAGGGTRKTFGQPTVAKKNPTPWEGPPGWVEKTMELMDPI